MRILFLSPQPFYVQRGTPIAVRAALEVLGEAGHQIDLLAYHDGEDVAIPGVRVHRIRRPPLVRRVPIGPSWQKAACDLHLYHRARTMLSVGRYDVVHAVEEAAFMAAALKRRFGVPFVYDMDSEMSEQIAEKGVHFRPLAAAFRRMERRTLRSAAGVLAVCPALLDVARRHHPGRHIALLPDMPLSDTLAEPSREILEIPGCRFVYVGNLEAYQGVDLMLAAFARIAEESSCAVLVVVGGGTPSAISRLRRAAPALIESGRVRLLGPRPVEQLGAVLAGADVLVSPRCAGRNTPMKIYSYLASGKPVLATRLPTHTQVLDDRVAVLVRPDAEAMADGMRRLLASPELGRRLGAAGRELAEREYSRSAFRARLLDFYGRLAESLPSSSARTAQTPVTPSRALRSSAGAADLAEAS